jgi:N-acetylglucosaminyldiphosphoundecaprenol N-acetyl-beta-D-mannosaminyltransferase
MILGYKIYEHTLESIDFNNNKVINTINSHSFITSMTDKDFKHSLKASDVLLPDGVGIVWAEKLLYSHKISKIAGYDLFLFLMNKLNNENGSVFFLGGTEETLRKIKIKCEIEYPNVSFFSYSPPFKESFTESESESMCNWVNEKKPDVLFVGMTAPKQEKWVHLNKNNLNAQNICSIGAVFNYYSEELKRSNKKVINNSGLEGIVRLISNPSKKLFHRNFVSVPLFILLVVFLKIFKLK